jgi:integrase/recombinase XerC
MGKGVSDSAGALFVNFHRSDKISGTRPSSTSLYRMVRELGKKTNQTVRPHGLRHISISEAVRNAQALGMDETKVMQFSRHKALKNLQVCISIKWRMHRERSRS